MDPEAAEAPLERVLARAESAVVPWPGRHALEGAAARAAFKTTWGKNVTGFERARLIHKLADLIERDAQELAELETLNNGKQVRIAR